MSDPVLLTGRAAAAARAEESERPDGLFADPLARALAGDIGFELLRELQSTAPEVLSSGCFAVRAKFFDLLLADAARTGVRQAVLLGAGMDTRAFRLELPAGTVLHELDLPELVALKQRLLAGAGAHPGCQVRRTGADLVQDDWADRLCAAGFRSDRPAVWIAEGLLQYLGAEPVQRLFARITLLSAPGSALGFDLIGREALGGPLLAGLRDRLRSGGSPLTFGDDPSALGLDDGWRCSTTRLGEPGAHFGRLPADAPDPLPYHFVVARRGESGTAP